MAQEPQKNLPFDLGVSNDEFDEMLAKASKERWWQIFLKVVQSQRDLKTNDVMSGRHDSNQRAEDRAKGEIQFATFILNLGARGSKLIDQKEQERRHGS